MSAPVTKAPDFSTQTFLDGSVAGRRRDDEPWTVIAGADLNHNAVDAPCEAADFAKRQNRHNRTVYAGAAAKAEADTRPT